MGGPGREARIQSGARALPGGRSPAAGTAAARRAEPAGRPRAARRKVSSAQLRGRPRPATPRARPQTEIKRRAAGPSAPGLPAPLRSVTRTVRAGSGFHWWPGSHQAPPTARGSPAPFRARVCRARAPPRRPPLLARERCAGSWAPAGGDAGRRGQLAFHFCPSDPLRGRYGTETTSRESEEAPRPGARDGRDRCLFWRRAEAASKNGGAWQFALTL